MTELAVTERTRLRRLREQGRPLRAELDAVLAAGFLCHLAGAVDGVPMAVPTVYGVADYLLSKRTDVYLEMDHTHLSGASVNDLNAPISFAGARNNFGAGLSLRTRF